MKRTVRLTVALAGVVLLGAAAAGRKLAVDSSQPTAVAPSWYGTTDGCSGWSYSTDRSRWEYTCSYVGDDTDWYRSSTSGTPPPQAAEAYACTYGSDGQIWFCYFNSACDAWAVSGLTDCHARATPRRGPWLPVSADIR